MEKVIYLVRAREGYDINAFQEVALGLMSEELLAMNNVQKLRVSFNDGDVARADGLKQENAGPLPHSMISLWVDTGNSHGELEAIIKPHTSRIEGYLVTESEVLRPPSEEGQRTAGTMQLCCLGKRKDLSLEAFLNIWRNSHGPIAIETQSTFGYRQHIVVRKLTEDAQDHTAIIEEHFPAEAMDSPHAFFDAVNDDKRLAKNRNAMVESCARFIDFNQLNCIHMSEYTVKE